MVYEERNTWASLIASALAVAVYVIATLQQAGGGPLVDVDWVPLMLWTIGGAIVGAIVLSIGWGILAGFRDRDGVGRSDDRDRDIARMGDRVGQAFLVLAGLAAIVLCAVDAEMFWIANTLFLGFVLSFFVGSIARVTAYRRGLL